jgi:phospholipid/cholesterol/gamma-HCH transport system permease protein
VDGKMTDATLVINDDGVLVCQGTWIARTIAGVETHLDQLLSLQPNVREIDASGIHELDSAGALLLQIIAQKVQPDAGGGVKGLHPQQQNMYALVQRQTQKGKKIKELPVSHDAFYTIGVWAYDKYLQTLDFITFIGSVALGVFATIKNPKTIQWRAMLNSVDVTGYQALPIVALMSFLIGVVLAYQLAGQLKVYGADIFIVDVTGVGIFREFAPLITAIIVAGRTSTSFAALIGTMKVNEEIDAMMAMGLSPIDRLVLPRIFGILIAMPLLVVWADLFGILGSMVMSKNMLNISFYGFMDRLHYAVEVKQYILGLIKAPFFALIIAGVGCFQGLQVGMSAESVGAKTTKAAVQAIFLIIIADAAFSIIFNEMGY